VKVQGAPRRIVRPWFMKSPLFAAIWHHSIWCVRVFLPLKNISHCSPSVSTDGGAPRRTSSPGCLRIPRRRKPLKRNPQSLSTWSPKIDRRQQFHIVTEPSKPLPSSGLLKQIRFVLVIISVSNTHTHNHYSRFRRSRTQRSKRCSILRLDPTAVFVFPHPSSQGLE
jgi:hypothetical protein